MDCDRDLKDIYGEIMELVKVSFCVSNTIILLIFNSVSSLGSTGSTTRERVMEMFRRIRDPMLDGPNLFGSSKG